MNDQGADLQRLLLALERTRAVAKEAIAEVERLATANARLRAIVDAAIAVDKSPGYRECMALRETLKSMGTR